MFEQRISAMTVELPNTRRVIPVLHGDRRDRALGRVSGAAWTTDGGLALDIVMANTTTARTFYADELADPRWPMYAHPSPPPASRELPQARPAGGGKALAGGVLADRHCPRRPSARVPDRDRPPSRESVVASMIRFVDRMPTNV